CGVWVRRRHAILFDDFCDHGGPADGFVIVRQWERADVARAMAFDATLVEQRRNVLGVVYRACRWLLALAADKTTDGIGLGNADWFAGQQLIERVFQFGVLGLVLHIADSPLIVDAAAITDR